MHTNMRACFGEKGVFMGYTEYVFLFAFLPFSIVLYILVSQFKNAKLNNSVLIILSLLFYSWGSFSTVLLFLLFIFIAYLLGNLIYYVKKSETPEITRVWMLAAAAVPVLFLVYSKYAGYILAITNRFTGLSLSAGNPVVLIGISFITFEAVSYITDIFRGDAEPGTFLDVMVFFSLFPKLVSGPIVLWKDFSPQTGRRDFLPGQVEQGINRIIIGYAKKAVIADSLGAVIAEINLKIAAGGFDSGTIWLKSLLYFFEIYYDFAGYSDIAIGICSIFGFRLKENFNFPYISTSVTEFWRRWHISLGTWFREYVYIPLGGNRKGNVYLNLFIVFMLTGIWHGENMTFILWGIMHGICIVTERIIRNKKWYTGTPVIIRWLITMFIVYLGWILFMSESCQQAAQTILALFGRGVSGSPDFTWQYFLRLKVILLLVIAVAGSLIGAVRFPESWKSILCSDKTLIIRRALFLLLFAVDILFIINSTYSPFIYFQF